MATYTGRTDEQSRNPTVLKNGLRLDPRPSQALRNHSPDGFNWGYGGSGPAQLSLALLLDVLGPELAIQHYQVFKRCVVAVWPNPGSWTTNDEAIETWLLSQFTPVELCIQLVTLAKGRAAVAALVDRAMFEGDLPLSFRDLVDAAGKALAVDI